MKRPNYTVGDTVYLNNNKTIFGTKCLYGKTEFKIKEILWNDAKTSFGYLAVFVAKNGTEREVELYEDSLISPKAMKLKLEQENKIAELLEMLKD